MQTETLFKKKQIQHNLLTDMINQVTLCLPQKALKGNSNKLSKMKMEIIIFIKGKLLMISQENDCS